jgi:hypothetical protein
MTDITITPTSVVAGANASTETGMAGEAITAGKLVYRAAATQKLMLSDTNAAAAEAHKPLGVALNGASLNQPVMVQKHGDITIGATLVVGDSYYASDTAGGICPRADVAAGEEVVLIGLAKSTTVLAIDIQAPGVTL